MDNGDGQSQPNGTSWKQFYEAALLEVDSKLLPQRIAEAQKVIAERNAILQSKGEYNSEIEALRNAHILLDDLNRIYCPAPRDMKHALTNVGDETLGASAGLDPR